jgi:type II secretory pathway predicted ATPase ExeA
MQFALSDFHPWTQATQAMHDDRQYLQYFTLTARPFYDLEDPRFVWLGEKQLETLLRLKNGVDQRKGVALLTGVAGAGKSVLVNRFLRMLPEGSISVLLREAGLRAERYRQLMAEQLALPLPQGETKGDFLGALKAFLEAAYRSGKYVVVVAEDLETAEDEVIEQLRLLSNLETPDHEQLLTILITGNSRLEERLSTYEHRALQQRVEARRTADALTVAETGAYIRHRLMVAGAFLEIFTAEAVERIHRFAGGLPKPIDFICDHALKRACIDKKRKIDGAMIAGYVKEIRATSQIGLNHAADEGRSKFKLTNLPALTAGFVLMIALSLYLFQKNLQPHPPAPPVPPPAFSLQFEARSATIPAGDFGKLDAAANFLIANPRSRAMVTSSSESASTLAYARRIASERPAAVRTYLVSRGVAVDRVEMVASAAGNKPVANQEASGKSRSVRVEIAFPP